MRIRYTKIKRLCLVQNFSSDSLIVYTQLKAELHPKVELPLIVLLPPSGATFGIVRGGRGQDISLSQVCCPHFREPQPQGLTSPWGSLLLNSPSPAARPVGERSGASYMCSRVPGVKPKGYTARFPYSQWRQQYLTADGNIRCSADITGLQDRYLSNLFKASSCSMCSCWLLNFAAMGRSPL